MSAKGRFALARALLAQGERANATLHAREAWRYDAFSRDVETMAHAALGELLSRDDHKIRMDVRLYAEDTEAGMRAAQRLGATEVAIAKARIAVIRKASNAKAALDAVPVSARRDLGYIFSRAQWHRRRNQTDEAAQLLLSASREGSRPHGADEWWIERRLVARQLLDQGDPKRAYRIASEALLPIRENYRGEQPFTAGWIALRFLNDPAAAATHFALVGRDTTNPITLARASYWQGRAAEAMARHEEARSHYQSAARYSTAYYGQIARARLGMPQLALHAPPQPSAERAAALKRLEVVRAVEILYAIDERNLIGPIMIDLADKAHDVAALALLGEFARQHNDARAMLLVGKTALGRGLALEHYAFPDVGVPNFKTIGPEVERSLVYAIARQESAFNPRAVSSAKAMGLMQVMPGTGRAIAKKFGTAFDRARMLNDAAYNTQLGAAELGDLIRDYRGSYILAFVGYNAGRGRVREWLERYGDPRDPKVDPIDWVERIPFSETRNYVQRVMENVQVYRVRLGGDTRLAIDADLRRGAQN